MKSIKYMVVLIVFCLLLMNLNVNSAFVIKDKKALINAYNNQNLIRLHVIANSNSVIDQYLKRTVRNEVIDFLSNHNNNPEIFPDLKDIENHIDDIIKREGFELSVDVQYGNFYFPRRTYGDVTLPAGEYRALKIILGNGKGSNWWCVLSPPLCIDQACETEEKNQIKFRLKIFELIQSFFTEEKLEEKLEENNMEILIDKLNIRQDGGDEKDLLFFTSRLIAC